MELLRAMGINMIRQGPDIPPRWVTWIHANYGIYTMINHTMGRYGATIDYRLRADSLAPRNEFYVDMQRKALGPSLLS